MLQVDIRRYNDLEENSGPFKLFQKLCGHKVGKGRLGNVDERKRYLGTRGPILWLGLSDVFTSASDVLTKRD
jgi:hypothetical protein